MPPSLPPSFSLTRSTRRHRPPPPPPCRRARIDASQSITPSALPPRSLPSLPMNNTSEVASSSNKKADPSVRPSTERARTKTKTPIDDGYVDRRRSSVNNWHGMNGEILGDPGIEHFPKSQNEDEQWEASSERRLDQHRVSH